MKVSHVAFDTNILAPGSGQEPTTYMCTERYGKAWLKLDFDVVTALLRVQDVRPGQSESLVAYVPASRIKRLVELVKPKVEEPSK